MHINAKKAAVIQRIVWHIRWVLLLLLMIGSLTLWLMSIDLRTFLCFQAFGWALFFFLQQWEKYFECQANCKL
ncbi:hypothetical protein ACE1TI_19865 [Alteribacillus sp. JSM 102045]|uniref:hypothetical protein n=1 Tax=Alteribacillus sp. JSM 102045 TaxID=1562101 RepID=UPI0035C0CCAC